MTKDAWMDARWNRTSLNDDPDFGFRLVCKKCGSDRVTYGNDLGFSAESGAWGSVDLECEACGNETTLVGS